MKRNHPVTYLASVAIVTVFSAIIYVTVQQTYRSGANDPQLQVARDMANKLGEDKSIDQYMEDTVDIAKSLSVFKVLFDHNNMPFRSTGLLNEKFPQLPVGVFDFAARNGENVFSWQPSGGVRVAMVLKSVRGTNARFIGVGRSLLEVEKREANLVTMTVTAWIIMLAIILFHFLATSFFKKLKDQD
jgi:hypothetical protein